MNFQREDTDFLHHITWKGPFSFILSSKIITIFTYELIELAAGITLIGQQGVYLTWALWVGCSLGGRDALLFYSEGSSIRCQVLSPLGHCSVNQFFVTITLSLML